MVLDIEESTPYIAIGVVLGIIFMLVFSWQFGLSPLTKIVLLLAGFGVFFVGAYERILPSRRVFYSISGLSFVVAIMYGVSVFDPGTNSLLAILLLSSGLFLYLGYRLQQGELDYDEHRAHQLIIGLVVFCALLTGYDVISGDARTELRLQDQVRIQDQDSVRVGELVVRNPSLLPRNQPYPSYRACIGTVNGTRYLPLDIDRGTDPGLVGPGSTETYPVTISVPMERTEDGQGRPAFQGTYQVTTGTEIEGVIPSGRPSCDTDVEQGQIRIETMQPD